MDNMAKKYIVFIFVIGAILSTLALPLSGFNQPPSVGQINTQQINNNILGNATTAQITTVNNQQASTVHYTVTNTTTTTTTIITSGSITSTITTTSVITTSAASNSLPGVQTCIGGTGIFGAIQNTVCNIDIVVHNALISTYCSAARVVVNSFNINTNYCSTPQVQLAQSIGNSLLTKSPSIFDVSGGYQNSIQVVSGNNELITIVSNPLTQAIIIAVAFVALGLLAGTLGAGLLANVVSRVGLFLSLFYYLNAQMFAFGNIPAIIGIFINVFIDVPAVVLLYESLGGSKSE